MNAVCWIGSCEQKAIETIEILEHATRAKHDAHRLLIMEPQLDESERDGDAPFRNRVMLFFLSDIKIEQYSLLNSTIWCGVEKK